MGSSPLLCYLQSVSFLFVQQRKFLFGLMESVTEESEERNDLDALKKIDGNGSKKISLVKQVEKKSGNSKPATAHIKAHLSKQSGKSDSVTATAKMVQSEGVKDKVKVKSMKIVHGKAQLQEMKSHKDLAHCQPIVLVLGVMEELKKGKSFILSFEEKIHAKEEEKNTLQAKQEKEEVAMRTRWRIKMHMWGMEHFL
ncbi:hypothetical protein L2E82_17048 [Cichorium intybus]|uniref:Uncharacterized protein n=1 Tax=Cichorium intybus TaxID=13427 RepID=A0ACB9F775_CICIN|nr:hypothetical protein L2E82_17048 [Cichorium intybus]